MLQLLQTEEREHAALFPRSRRACSSPRGLRRQIAQAHDQSCWLRRLLRSVLGRGGAAGATSGGAAAAQPASMRQQRAARRLGGHPGAGAQVRQLEAAAEEARQSAVRARLARRRAEGAPAERAGRDTISRAARRAGRARRPGARAALIARHPAYMETEDHEGLFPVVAMRLRLEPAEVESVRERRHRREAATSVLARYASFWQKTGSRPRCRNRLQGATEDRIRMWLWWRVGTALGSRHMVGTRQGPRTSEAKSDWTQLTN